MSQMYEAQAFLDSSWTHRNPAGSFSLVLNEQIEVPSSSVLWLADGSVVGPIPTVSLTENKLYVVERTPKTFSRAATVKASDTPGAG